MSFISFAQNFEDVMLWRALKHVENGFYIDVGANDPTLYSVTRAFYDKGWHGINLEPVAEFFKRLAVQRPRDINLQIGAGDVAGSFPFFDIPDTGLATSDPAIAKKHQEAGWEVNTIDIPVLPLAEICQRHVRGDIHFLKIDVEGAEKKVLLGMDFKKWRPWLILIEATAPLSQETVHQNWEFLVTDSAYEFVYFDGLNRYYVAYEHAELKPAFATPPNVFDNYVTTWQVQAQQAQQAQKIQAEESAALLEESAALLEESAALLDQEQIKVTQLQTNLQLVYASTSWRMSLPLRLVSTRVKRLTSGSAAAKSLLKAKIKWVLVHAKLYIVRRPLLSRVVSALIFSFPALEKKLRQITMSELPIHAKYIHSGFDPHSLTKDAQAIYQDLKLAMAEQTKVTH